MQNLIDKDALMSELTAWSLEQYPKRGDKIQFYKHRGIAETMQKVWSFQTADVSERNVGKWKLNKDGNWACQFCEFDPYHDNMNGMNYCPNCGAKMDGEEADHAQLD